VKTNIVRSISNITGDAGAPLRFMKCRTRKATGTISRVITAVRMTMRLA